MIVQKESVISCYFPREIFGNLKKFVDKPVLDRDKVIGKVISVDATIAQDDMVLVHIKLDEMLDDVNGHEFSVGVS